MLKFSEFLDQVQSHFESGLPIAVFRKPNSSEVVAYLQSDLSNNHPDTLSEGFLMAPFSSKNNFEITTAALSPGL